MPDKKIVLIKASMHAGGNSDLLADEFAKGAEEAGNNVICVELRKKNIRPCLGCNACHIKGREGQCVQNDDMPELNEQLKEADVIAFATPTYYYNMPGQLKTFIDRTFAVFTKLAHKELYYMITCTDDTKESAEAVVNAFHGFAVCLPDSHEKGVVYGLNCPQHGDIRRYKAMEEAYEMGKSI